MMIGAEATVIVGEALGLDVAREASEDSVEIEVGRRRRWLRWGWVLPEDPRLRGAVEHREGVDLQIGSRRVRTANAS